MRKLLAWYGEFVAPDGHRRWDEIGLHLLVLTGTMTIIDRSFGDRFGLFYPRIPFGGVLDFLVYFAATPIIALIMAIGALGSYRLIKKLGRQVLHTTT